jgi:hypothetical protein
MRASMALILAALLVPAAACGSSPPTITSGVDPSIAISDMSDAQAIALCEAAQEAEQRLGEMLLSDGDWCVRSAVLTVLAFDGDAASCQAAVDACGSSGSSVTPVFSPVEPAVTCDGSFRDAIGSECTATVGDYEACGNATLALQQEVLESLNCNMDMSSGGADMSAEPAECTTLNAMGCTLDTDQSDSDSGDSSDV